MARRASERGDATFGGTARKGREVEPDWARGLTPDEATAEDEARRLDLATDPDTIDDPDVRERFLRHLNHIQETGDDPAGDDRPSAPRNGRRQSRLAAVNRGLPKARTGRPSLSMADGSGFALGVVLYALGLNYLRYGWPGVTGWLSAKFINKPMDGAGAAVSGAAAPGPKAQTPAQLLDKGLIPPGSVGSITPLPQGSIRGKDGLYYPVTQKATDLPAVGAVRGPAG